MAENSEISWTDATFNPWWGCTRVSPACQHCYAEKWAKRTGTDWGNQARRRFFGDKHWREPLKWNSVAEKAGKRTRVFCASMADVFEQLPTGHLDAEQMEQERLRLWQLIADTPSLDWLLLTKRPENAVSPAPLHWGYDGWPDNVWLGTTAENQEWADKRVPFLLQSGAKVKFLSMEPLLGPVDLTRIVYNGANARYIDCLTSSYFDDCGDFMVTDTDGPVVNWIITGGESGPGSRPMHPDWARSLRDQCQDACVPFHFKQWGNWQPFYDRDADDPDWRQIPAKAPNVTYISITGGSGFHGDRVIYFRDVGKKNAGRELDNRTWDEFPGPRTP